MAALKQQTAGAIEFRGIGGEMMQREGLRSLFAITDLSVMGLAEVLPRLPLLLRRMREASNDVLDCRPDVLVTIDAPDFSLRVAKRLRGRGIPLVHYVAPSVWAWKPQRARKMAAYLDRVMTLLPFEPDYFERVGLAADFVGHPVLESGADKGDGSGFRLRHGIAAGAKVVCLLPGSRAGEIDRLVPVLRETAGLLDRAYSGLVYIVPTVTHMADRVRAQVADWPQKPLVLTGEAEKYDAFAASNIAIAASGTVALELAMAGTPAVIVYRMNPLTAWIARKIVTVKYSNLVNILLDEEAVPELLLEDCRPERITKVATDLLNDGEVSERQRRRLHDAIAKLSRDGASPSIAAAQIVIDVIKKGRS